MSHLSAVIHERLKTRGWQQKQLALAWLESAGRGSPDTYVTRLSKLLNDADEAYDFVLDQEHPERLDGLARVLSLEPSQLRSLCEAAQSRITLVLDPRLGEKVKTHLASCAEASAGQFHCVEPEGDEDGELNEMRAALRDLAKKHRNAVVVLQSAQGGLDFFEGAAVKTSFVEALCPGYRLSALPDLLPPVKRSLHDTDGMPMIPDESGTHGDEESWPGVVRAIERERRISHQEHSLSKDPDWVARINEFGSREFGRWRFGDGPPLFRLDWLLPQAAKMIWQLESRAAGKDTNTALLWLHGNRILALYPEEAPECATAKREAIARHHEVHEVKSFAKLVEALGAIRHELNPEGEGEFDFDLSNELRAFAEETGVTLSIDVAWIRNVMRHHGYTKPDPAKETVSARRCSDADARFRAILDDLLDREFSMIKEWNAPVFFELETIRNAPLVHLVSNPQSLVALANVGAGNMAEMWIHLFPRERPGIVCAVERKNPHEKPTHWNGNDIRFGLSCYQNQRILEGTIPRSVVNHRRKAAEAARDDWDDD